MFAENDKHRENVEQLSVVNETTEETNSGFTPREFKKRRLMDPATRHHATNHDPQRKQLSFGNKLPHNDMQQRLEDLTCGVQSMQALFRCYLAQKQLRRMLAARNSSMARQQYYVGVIKSQLMSKRVRTMYLNYQNASITLQCAMKTYCAQKRCHDHVYELERRRLQQLRLQKEAELQRLRQEQQERAAQRKQQREEEEVGVAQYMSSMLHCKRIREQYLLMKRSSVVLQSAFRGYVARRRYMQTQQSALCIQSFVRGHLWRMQYLAEQCRMQRQRREREQQRIEEEERRKQRQLRKRQCAEGLLALWRMYKFRQRVHEKRMLLMRRNGAATFIQSWFDGAMMRRQYMEYKRQQNEEYVQKVSRLQALMRGKLLRMQCLAQQPDLQAIVSGVHLANSKWSKENTVNYVLQAALTKLAESKTLYGVSEACDALQSLLKVVPNISHRIVEHNIIGSLFNVLRNSNRSVPHLNLVHKILHFLLFFAKHDDKCYRAIFDRQDTLDVLSERLQVHRLDFPLFEMTTQLFFIGVDVDVPSAQNRFLMNLRQSDVNRQIRTVHNIMSTKLQIAKRVNKPLRNERNANDKHKVKFEQERILAKCVQNMNQLVDKL